jgi:hypothetical protein
MDSTTNVQTFILQENECVDMSQIVRRRLVIVKWIGSLLLLFTCTTALVVVINYTGGKPMPLDYEIKVNYTNTNRTPCLYFEKYTFLEDEYTVCQTKGDDVYIDINVNGSATIMNLPQWLTHHRLSAKINASIAKARTYVRGYKRLV